MLKIPFKGKEVTELEIEGVDPKDYPDFCDTYFSTASWKESGEKLNDSELDQLTNENGDVLYELAHESFQGIS